MARKDELIALATPFGINTEGLTVAQLEEKLNANEGYNLYLSAKGQAHEANEARKAAEEKVVELEGDLRTANTELETANTALDKVLEDLAAAQTTKGVENTPEAAPGEFIYNRLRYGFKANAPKRINVEGVVRSQEELLNDEEAMIALIVGGNTFITRIV